MLRGVIRPVIGACPPALASGSAFRGQPELHVILAGQSYFLRGAVQQGGIMGVKHDFLRHPGCLLPHALLASYQTARTHHLLLHAPLTSEHTAHGLLPHAQVPQAVREAIVQAAHQ